MIQTKRFATYFGMAFLAGVLVQLILPKFAPGAFNQGLVKMLKDPETFFNIAVAQADLIKSQGWQVFQLSPQEQFPSGILSALFVIFGISWPFIQIPVNSLFVGLSGVLIEQFFDEIQFKHRLRFLFTLILLFTPTSLGWITQIYKDIYLNFAFLMYFLGYFYLLKKRNWIYVVHIAIAIIIIFLVKPHWIEVLLLGNLAAILPLIFIKSLRSFRLVVPLVIIGITFVIPGPKKQVYGEEVSKSLDVPKTETPVNTPAPEAPAVVKFEDFNYRPSFKLLDKFTLRLGLAHNNFHINYAHSKERYHPDWKLESAWEVIKYMPLALIYGHLDPFPWRWRWDQGLGKGAMFALLQLEMLLIYAAYFALIYFGRKAKREDQALIVSFFIIGAVYILVMGFASPNLGAINRYRFPFFTTLKLLAIYVWVTARRPSEPS